MQHAKMLPMEYCYIKKAYSASKELNKIAKIFKAIKSYLVCFPCKKMKYLM